MRIFELAFLLVHHCVCAANFICRCIVHIYYMGTYPFYNKKNPFIHLLALSFSPSFRSIVFSQAFFFNENCCQAKQARRRSTMAKRKKNIVILLVAISHVCTFDFMCRLFAIVLKCVVYIHIMLKRIFHKSPATCFFSVAFMQFFHLYRSFCPLSHTHTNVYTLHRDIKKTKVCLL